MFTGNTIWFCIQPLKACYLVKAKPLNDLTIFTFPGKLHRPKFKSMRIQRA